MRSRLPVCIVGAGPAGLVAANLLGQRGVPTLLLERNATTSDLPRAIVLDDEALRVCQALGLEEEVSARLRFGLYAQYFSVRACDFTPEVTSFAEVHPPRGPAGFDQLVSFSQPELERVWLGGLRRFPCVQVRFGCSLEGLTQHAEGVTVTFTDAAGASRRVECAYLLGCDGGRSRVRELTGIPMVGSTFSQPWVVLDVRNERRERRAFRFYCDPPRPSMDGPGPGEAYRYEFMLLPGETPEQLLRHEVLAELVRYDRELRPEDVVRKAVYTFHARTAERMRLGRVFLLGDAAHLMPPFAGQGLNSCLRDALNLCWKLDAVLRGEASEAILDSYDVERQPNVRGMIRASIALGRIVMATSRPWKLVRNALFALIRAVPKLRRDFREFKLKAPARHERGLYVAPGSRSGGGRAGWLLPQPQVACSDGVTRRLDDVLSTGFALLVGGTGVVPRLAHPLWARVAPRRVHVLAQGPVVPPGADGTVVLDAAGELALAPGQAALVRPDRFVAGVFPLSEADRFAERFTQVYPHAHEDAVGARAHARPA